MKVSQQPRLAHHTPTSEHYTVTNSALAKVQSELSGREVKPDEILIRADTSQTGLQDFGLDILETYELGADVAQTMRARLPEGVSLAQGLAALRQHPGMEFAEPNAILHLNDFSVDGVFQNKDLRAEEPSGKIPNDLDFRMWAMDNNGRRKGKAGADISALSAWETSVGSRLDGPLIAVIDTGIDYTHPDLADNMWTNPGEVPGDGIDNDGNGVVDDEFGYNAVDDTGDPKDDHSHGTHCAGTIGAVGNNGLGVVGVNWQAQLMAVKIFDKRGQTSLDTILRGLDYAHKMGADITNNSWGDSHPSEAIKQAFASMDQAVHFAAAGNNRNNNDHRQYYPVGHDLPNMIGVAASDRSDNKPTFSNYGKKTVEVTAPGAEILSTVIDGGYGMYSGTSMACPHATGVAGLVLTEFPELSAGQVRDRLIHNSDYVPALSAASVSRGRINAAASLEHDSRAPAAPRDFGVARANSKGVTLSWTSTGDDHWCGGAPSAIELWVSDQPIDPDALDQLEGLEVRSALPTGEVQEYHMPLEHSEVERDYHFAFRLVDNVGNRSDLSLTTAHVPAAVEVYQTNFGPNDGFAGEDEWARIPSPRDASGWAWTDSPDGKSKNRSNASLTSPVISLAGITSAKLDLEARYEFLKLDKTVLEVRSGGESWTSLGSFHGNKRNWNERSFDLSEFDGQEIQVRLRVQTDGRHTKDGIYVDRLGIVGDRS